MSSPNSGFVDSGARASSSPTSSPASDGVPLPSSCDYPSLRSRRAQDVLQSIVKSRKNWKTLRGGEYVWPPELEAALIEGLESYQPDDSRETRLLGRFPMRNRFISEHIYRKTGKRRTAKQVGSRLQQLRDTCGGKRLLNLLSPYRRPPPRPRWPDSSAQYDVPPLRQDTESSSEASSSTPTTPVDSHRRLDNGYDYNLNTIPETVVYIDLLPDGCTSPEVHSDANPSGSIGPMDQQSTLANGSVVHASDSPRHFSSIDPTITFMAPSTLSARSLYTVYMHGTSVFSEATALSPVGPPPGESQGTLLYSTSLVPGFWDVLSKTPDPTQYIIVQHVVQDTPSPTSLAFSAVYKFRYPTKPLRMSDRIPSPITHMEPVTHTNVDYNDFNSLLAMEYEFPSFEPKNEWEYCSPHSSDRELSSYSRTSRSPSSEHDEDSDSLLSPSTACFPMDLSNYVL